MTEEWVAMGVRSEAGQGWSALEATCDDDG